MKKKFIAIVLAVIIIISGGTMLILNKENTNNEIKMNNAQIVSAPNKDLNIQIWLDDGVPYYAISLNGETLVTASKMGLETTLGDLSSGFSKIELVSTDFKNENWKTLVGEKSEIKNNYNESVFCLKGKTDLSIEVKAFDTGIAFRYLLPKENYTITNEQTQISLNKDGIALCHEETQQSAVKKHNIKSMNKKTNIYPPLTAVFDSGKAMTVTVSNIENYTYPILNVESKCTLKPITQEVTVKNDTPVASPYWTFIIGDELKDLPNNKDIILNLNNEPNEEKYHFTDWVKPGKALMLGLFNETTESLHDYIDTAKEYGLDYVILDFGWYGPEFDPNSDPRLNPEKLIADKNDSKDLANSKAFMRQYVTADGVFDASKKPFNVYDKCPWGGEIMMSPNLNIPEIVKYAKSKDVGIFLYVNNVQLNDTLKRYTVDELFDQFEKWGVAGVKPGFVPNKSQDSELNVENIIRSAAKHRLMLTIHDDWVQSGIEREYPNLISVEGVYGDEGLTVKDIKEDLNSLFARGIQGVTDHTICYPGKATKGFQLAESVLWPTGLNCVYWPWKNTDTENLKTIKSLPKQETEFWKNMPASWDDTVIIEADVSQTAITARKTVDDWYVGAISAKSQDLTFAFEFLDSDKEYIAEIYCDPEGVNAKNANRDNADANIEIIKINVTNKSTFKRKMKYGTGFAIHITPIK